MFPPHTHPATQTLDAAARRPDMGDLRSLEPHIRRALEVSAAGNHDLMIKGSPAAITTALAHRLGSIRPTPTKNQRKSIARNLTKYSLPAHADRPFRAPHHTISALGLVSELEIAAHGILYLSEWSEHPPERRLEIEQYGGAAQIVAAVSPCCCGWYGSARRPCTCGESARTTYTQRAAIGSARFEIFINLSDKAPVNFHTQESSAASRERADRARDFWRQTFLNHKMSADAQSLLGKTEAIEYLSENETRAARRIARTIADLDQSDTVSVAHVAEAIGYARNPLTR